MKYKRNWAWECTADVIFENGVGMHRLRTNGQQGQVKLDMH